MASAVEKHRRWIAWRRKMVEEHHPDVCPCYIGKPFMRAAKSCKDCQICPACEQHVRNKYWKDHALNCRALTEAGADVDAESRIRAS